MKPEDNGYGREPSERYGTCLPVVYHTIAQENDS